MGGGPAIGCGRAFVEDKARLSRPQLEGLLEGALLLPERHDLLLKLGEAALLVDFLKHRQRLRSAAITKYAPSVTTSGERSIPEIGGRRRRTGPTNGTRD